MWATPLTSPLYLFIEILNLSSLNHLPTPALFVYSFTEILSQGISPYPSSHGLFTKSPSPSISRLLGHPHGLNIVLHVTLSNKGCLISWSPCSTAFEEWRVAWERIRIVLVAFSPFFSKKYFIGRSDSWEFMTLYSTMLLSYLVSLVTFQSSQYTWTIHSLFVFSFLPGLAVSMWWPKTQFAFLDLLNLNVFLSYSISVTHSHGLLLELLNAWDYFIPEILSFGVQHHPLYFKLFNFTVNICIPIASIKMSLIFFFIV